MKHCTKCKQEKDHSEFSLNRGKGDGLQQKCKECTRLPSPQKSTHSYKDYIEKAGLADYKQRFLRIN